MKQKGFSSIIIIIVILLVIMGIFFYSKSFQKNSIQNSESGLVATENFKDLSSQLHTSKLYEGWNEYVGESFSISFPKNWILKVNTSNVGSVYSLSDTQTNITINQLPADGSLCLFSDTITSFEGPSSDYRSLEFHQVNNTSVGKLRYFKESDKNYYSVCFEDNSLGLQNKNVYSSLKNVGLITFTSQTPLQTTTRSEIDSILSTLATK